MANRRLAIIRHAQEVSGSVAKTCRYYGISRQSYYKWLRRYEEHGPEGLKDRSRAALSCPHATRTEVVGKVIYLRRNYHFGPQKIAMYLKRYHDVTISVSGVWRILKRLEMNRLPAYQRYKRHKERWKRYEKPQPGHRVQIDVKFIEPIKGARRRHYQFTAIDDCTRAPGASDLRRSQPEDRDPVRRLRDRQAALPGAGHPDRQRCRVPVSLPLACA